MIEESGKIVAIGKDFVWVETMRKSACDACSAKNGCGHRALSRGARAGNTHVRARNQYDLDVGDPVTIGIPEDVLMKGSLVVYLLPLLLMMLSSLTVDGIWSSDGATGLAGIFGLAVGFALVWLFSRRVQNDQRYQPVVLRPVAPAVVVSCFQPEA